MLTQEELKQILDYNPETGIFTWKFTSRNGTQAGSEAGSKKYCSIYGIPKCIDIYLKGKLYRARKLAWLYVYGEWSYAVIDHENGNPFDNVISNLRLASQSQNNFNQKLRSDNTTGVKGVGYLKSINGYRARIQTNKKPKAKIFLIADYPCWEDALDAAKQWITDLRNTSHGEFARHI
jgi:hypothetical protein